MGASMSKYVVCSVEGSEEVTDPRLLVIKGSGSTYVAGGKIGGWVRPLLKQLEIAGLKESTVVDRRLAGAFFVGLPRTSATLQELFLAVARQANVFNNFAEGMSLWQPLVVMGRVLELSKMDEVAFRAAVVWPVGFDEAAGTVVALITVGDFAVAMRDVVAIAELYEPFLEKAFELTRAKKA